MELRTQNNQIHLVLISTISISTGNGVYWLTIGMDASSLNRPKKEQQNDILKIFDSYDDGGVVLLDFYEKERPCLFYTNEEANKIFRQYPLDKLLHKLGTREILYLVRGIKVNP